MDKINKALHGVIQPDGKWHELYDYTYSGAKCICDNKFHYINKRHATGNPDYFSKEGFWDAKSWIKENDMANKFILFSITKNIKVWDIFDYKTFAKHLHSFLVAEGIIK